MACVYDVGAFIKSQLGIISEYRLQKLTYYAQAWSIAWDNRPLFHETIKAWVDGPVCPELWHSGTTNGCPERLSDEEQKTILGVLDFYNRLTDQQLIDLTHREKPWRDARRGLEPNEKGSQPITVSAMRGYYRPLAQFTSDKQISNDIARGIWFVLDVPEDQIEELTKLETVDSEAALQWLETGERDPWAEQAEE